MKKAIIGVGIAGYPVSAAGNTWAFLQWVLGFQKLGWDVWVVEGIESAKCIDENYKACSFKESANKSHWEKITGEFGFKNSLFIDGKTENEKDLILFARDAEIFLNISGHFKELGIVRDISDRIYLDLDPAFTQIWARGYQCDMNFHGHNRFFSVGTRMENARIPETGHQWLPTLPPVDLDYWQPQSPKKKQKSEGYWTTVTHWYGYPDIEWDGILYSGKGAEFDKLILLPKKTKAKLMIATDLDSQNKVRQNFEKNGWKITSGPSISKNWKDYRNFVGASRGECCVAKGGYVVSKCGWFSDRSACYLAAGRPVVLQETGWSSILGGDEGLLPFTDLESAAAALDKIESDYETHSLAARKIAEEKLDNKKVVAAMLEKISQKD